MTWPIIAVVLILAGVVDVVAMAPWYARSWPRSQVLGPALVRGPAGGKRFALTFADGPSPPFTDQILDILQTLGARTTFFVCGKDAERHPEFLRRVHSEGHAIGNHTWSHSYLYFLSRRQITEEIDRTQEVIRKVTGQVPRLFRPPYGARWFGLYPVLQEQKMKLVQWSVNPLDWKLEADGILASVREGFGPGAVILLHLGRQAPGGYLHRLLRRGKTPDDHERLNTDKSATVEALPAILDCAQAAGFEFVPVEDFLPMISNS
jgi:peptidoglycan/xylan/chitin deacetylase (PgdA/CDA1 family)